MNLTHTLSNSRATHFALRVLAVTLLLIGGFALRGHPVSAATQNGVATISDPSSSQPLASGGSDAKFTVALPTQAACSGDTATDGYKLYSYLVHSGTDIGSISEAQFGSTGPSVGFGITDISGQLYGAVNVSSTPKGLITGIPNNFQWSQLTSAEGIGVPLTNLLYDSGNTTGTWSTGLLCADTNGAASDWWNAEVTFKADAADAHGFTWTATPGGGVAPAAPTTTTTAPKPRVTTTTKPHVTTTTTADDPVTTTTTTGDASTTTTVVVSGTGVTPVDPIDTSSGFSDPTATGGTLPRTGSPVNREVGLGLLAIGAGMMIIGLEWRWKARGALAS